MESPAPHETVDTTTPETSPENDVPRTRMPRKRMLNMDEVEEDIDEKTALKTRSPKHHRSSIGPSLNPTVRPFIGISGLIGAGKSTLATALAKELGLPTFYEPVVDNEYLEPFYSDMKRYGFPLQVYLLNNRFRQHQQIIWSGEGGVADRTIYEDAIFAKILMEGGNMEERDYRTYINLFNNMSCFMRKPDFIIHLDVSPEESLNRIKARSRDCETSISVDYLKALHKGYEEFLDDISRVIPVIRVNWSEFRTAEEMATVIKKEYEDLKTIRYVDFADRKDKKDKAEAEAEAEK